MRKISPQSGRNDPDTDLRLRPGKSRCLIGRYIPTISDVASKNRFVEEPAKYEKRVQKVLSTDELVSLCEKRNEFVLEFGTGEEQRGLSFVKLL